MIFVLLQCFPTCFFLKLSLSIFFNIELVENSALTFPTCFFFFFFSKLSFFLKFCMFFSELFLLIFSNYFVLSNILSSLSSLNSLNFPFMNRNVIEIKLRNEI